MNERLHALVDAYKSTVVRAVAALEASGIPRPATTTEWVGYDVPGRGDLVGGGEYFIHGFGCAVRLPDTSVDFDFGDTGQIDGFDWYRLSRFAGNQLSTRYGIRDENELRTLIDNAHRAGDLVHSGNILSYTRDSLPALGRGIASSSRDAVTQVQNEVFETSNIPDRKLQPKQRRMLYYWFWTWPLFGTMELSLHLYNPEILRNCVHALFVPGLIGTVSAGWTIARTNVQDYWFQFVSSAIVLVVGIMQFCYAS